MRDNMTWALKQQAFKPLFTMHFWYKFWTFCIAILSFLASHIFKTASRFANRDMLIRTLTNSYVLQ